MSDDTRNHPFRDSHQDVAAVRAQPASAQTRAPAYRLAFTDSDFLMREDLRPVRLQLELLKPQLILDERGVRSTVVIMGSARIPADPVPVCDPPGADAGAAGGHADAVAQDLGATDGGAARPSPQPSPQAAPRPSRAEGLQPWYGMARALARRVTEKSLASYGRDWVVCTGGGPGIMEAGNRGADEAGGQSIGLNIVLPHEQAPNAYVTPDLCFNFHYFAIRKMHFLMRARAICVFPGGFGTLDEMFECLTLIQTGRMRRIPVLLFGRAFWEDLVNWQALVDQGVIAPGDLGLIRFVETVEEAMAIMEAAPNP